MFTSMFESMDNDYGKNVLLIFVTFLNVFSSLLTRCRLTNPSLIDEEVIVIAEDLTPSDTAQLNKQYVKGFATNIGDVPLTQLSWLDH